ncbi:MAG: glycosyltransferase family 2 protein [Deltaproteobacteria bacterium]|nr:glycosyltransferase family 2 protein [Deltaproteobacteria bacterium]MCL4873327.1 glycosyltransferase family 2 protein [bacterium]
MGWQFTLEVIFWAGAAALFYAYIGYPLVLFFLSRALGEAKRDGWEGAPLPSVSVLVAAYNEEKTIGDKIRNTLSLDYPWELLEVVVASDGSSDGTAGIVRSFAAEDGRVRLLHFPRGGKARALALAMPQLRGEIVFFSDANTECDKNALRLIAGAFGDRRVGCVSGRLVYRNPGGIVSGKGESLYWRYETWLKRLESRLGCVSGANGAAYAIRKELFEAPPAGTVNDDFVISTMVAARGGRSVYEERAIVYEDVASSARGEFRRHVRDGAGHYIAVCHLARLLNPFLGLPAFIFWSHRVFRWAAPFILPALLVLNAMLLGKEVYRLAFAAQTAFYAAALLGFLGRGQLRLPFLFHAPFYFCNLNLALFIGFVKAVSGRQKMTWDRAGRA